MRRKLSLRVGALVASVVLASCANLPATSTSIPLNHLPALAGDYFPLRASANGHLYHIYVRLPDSYAAETAKRYPVVYLLDGDSAFPLLAPHHLFLTYDDKIPEAIIVGIAYGSFAKPTNRRHIDFMPPGPGLAPAEAGAAAFHAFLQDELLPTVESRFRADASRRILVGQSRGGAMVLYSAFVGPDLFWGRLASNASFKPGRDIFFGSPAPSVRGDLHLVVATGTHEDADRRSLALEWLNAWGARKAPWQLHRIDIEGGTHAADLPNAYRAAMRRLFGIETR